MPRGAPGSRPYDHDGWAVAPKHRICRHQRQRLLQRLRCEQAVEWLLVQLRQRLHTNAMCRLDVEKAVTASTKALRACSDDTGMSARLRACLMATSHNDAALTNTSSAARMAFSAWRGSSALPVTAHSAMWVSSSRRMSVNFKQTQNLVVCVAAVARYVETPARHAYTSASVRRWGCQWQQPRRRAAVARNDDFSHDASFQVRHQFRKRGLGLLHIDRCRCHVQPRC